MSKMDTAQTQQRRHWMAVLARASAADITNLLATMPALPPHATLRPNIQARQQPKQRELVHFRQSRLRGQRPLGPQTLGFLPNPFDF